MITLPKAQEDTSASEALPVLTCLAAVIAVIATTGWVFHGPGALTGKAQGNQIVDSCSGGNEVTRFVCRNTWLSHHKFSYR